MDNDKITIEEIEKKLREKIRSVISENLLTEANETSEFSESKQTETPLSELFSIH